MAGPRIGDPTRSPAASSWLRSIGEWIDTPRPEGWWTTPMENPVVELPREALRSLLQLVGVTDPLSQLMGLGTSHIPMKHKAAIEEARRLLEKTGPLPADELRTVLATVPEKYGHVVTEGLPGVAPPQRALRKILLPSHDPEVSPYILSPHTGERVQQQLAIGDAQPRTANWGGSRDPEMLNAFAGDRRASDLYGTMFAGLSPSTMVPKNTKESIAVWLSHLRDPGKLWTDQRLRDLGVGNTRSKTDNIIRATLGDPLSGQKVTLFGDFMGGGTPVPVPDMHYLRGIGARFDSIQRVLPELKALVEKVEGIPVRGGEEASRLAARDYVRRLNQPLADQLEAYGPGRTMGDLFGTFWNGSRALQGLKWTGGPADILRPRGLMERGAMLDERALLEALRDPRSWTALGLGGLAAAHAVGEPPPRLAPSH